MQKRLGRLDLMSPSSRRLTLRAFVAWGTLGMAAGPTLLDLKGMTGRRPSPPARVDSRPSQPPEPAPAPVPPPRTSRPSAESDPIAMARRAIAECRERYRQIRDYTCTFVKRERLGGELSPKHVMAMKTRTEPVSIYFKFHVPYRGREAIYVEGRHDGRVLAHDVGLGKLLAGTMRLDPKGTMAMEASRHPITEAGIGPLIETVAQRWGEELTPDESIVTFQRDVRIEGRVGTLIESIHPERQPGFLFHKVRLYIDEEFGLPTRFEAYDWPKTPGGAPELVEEYTYQDLQTDVGLLDHDFDPANRQYSFGRF